MCQMMNENTVNWFSVSLKNKKIFVEGAHILARVAEVGKLSASAKMPSILSSDAYLLIRNKNIVFSRITKIATKM